MNVNAQDKPTVKSFEDILAWQRSKELSILIYKMFSNSRDFGFRDQIQRAAVSVMNNIAEGYERNNDNEFRYYLRISKGSCGEVRSMLILAEELDLSTKNDLDECMKLALDVSRLLAGFLKTLDFQRSTFDGAKR